MVVTSLAALGTAEAAEAVQMALVVLEDHDLGVVRPNPRKFQSPQFSQRPKIF